MVYGVLNANQYLWTSFLNCIFFHKYEQVLTNVEIEGILVV